MSTQKSDSRYLQQQQHIQRQQLQQQQQSQIFVFSTGWANRAAEAVDKGQFNSIIEFHFHSSKNRLSDPQSCARTMDAPDEHLTPQQRQIRENKLALIRQLGQQFCPELMDSSPMRPMMRMSAPNQQHLNAPDYMMDNRNNMCSNMCIMSESEHMASGDPHLHMTANNHNHNNTTPYSQSHPGMGPTLGTTPLDWPTKGNYMEERRRKSQSGGPGVHNNMCSVTNSVPISHPSPLSQPSSAINSPSPGSRIPPPPYNQGIRPQHSSPHPSSPVTGSLPMPSPRMQSPADASRQSFASGGQPRPPQSSPRPPTPSADSNSSISGTGVHSPKSLPPSSGNGVNSPKPLVPSSNPSSASSTGVDNSCRTQSSANVPNLRATTPSSIAPPSPSPSNVKKLSNLMTSAPKGPAGQDCSDLLMNQMVNNRKLQHSNDMPLHGQSGPTNCSSPFMCGPKPEPALMPVPSPQQIQYLNAFEGQELTIQKQPNTSLRDADLISPAPDSGFGNDFGNSCQPFPQNGPNGRLPNFQMIENMNTRFASNPQNAQMSGHSFELNPRFMTTDNPNQRFMGPMGPVFEGSPRMPNSHESQFRPQNMVCMPYGQIDNNMMPFGPNNPCNNMMGPRVRAPTDMVGSTRFAQHLNDNIQSPQHFNSNTMSPMSSEQMNLMPFGANQPSGAGCMGAVNNFNPQMESSVSSTHLQNLQKMTPPFDIGPPNKADQMMLPNGSLPHNHNSHSSNNHLMHGSNGPMAPVSQSQRTNTFDPISSMAAMGEANGNNGLNAPNLMSGPSMNMSSMQVAANGGPPCPPNMVNFHTSMSSMQGIHQNMSPDGTGMNGQYGMGQMNPSMTGGPQTVNNTYVNATMSIQQLNIQNMSTPPNFNPNLDQSMNIGPQSMTGNGPGISPPAGAMQMMQSNSSTKLGSGFGHRMSGPTTGANFSGQHMNNPRGMSQMNYPPNPHMMQRCSAYNSANIQIKPDAPNTIQYLPPRQQNSNMSSRAPSLDFLQRCEPPLTNLGNKLPTHNLQYFPSNNANMNSSQPMPLGSRMIGQNMPMASGPGRPMNPSMVRAPNANPGVGVGGGQQPMMPSGDMFNRPPGPNNMMNIGSNAPNPMFVNMKQSGSGSMSPGGLPPDAAQPLPPTVGHQYNYNKSPFPPMTSDPNYAIQFQQFQQQLYATNTTRASNSSANSNTGPNNPRMPSNSSFYNNSTK